MAAKRKDSTLSKRESKVKGKANWGKMKAITSVTTLKGEMEEMETESEIVKDPLLEKGMLVDDELLLPGNKVMMNVNLSRNKITEVGLDRLHSALKYQQNDAIVDGSKLSGGLKKLSLKNNSFPEDDSRYADIMNILKSRDPLIQVT